ncbi:MAG: hypothetical protein FWG45_04520 [Oscillospiraceae bacterium]|nr:hypothetical protein [Oscillospiraceae bacterium]
MKLTPLNIYIGYVSWNGGGKNRPVLIIRHDNKSADVLNITTKFDGKSEFIRSKYFKINDWQEAGLLRQSYVETIETVSLQISSIDTDNLIGRLTENDEQRLIEFLSGFEQ